MSIIWQSQFRARYIPHSRRTVDTFYDKVLPAKKETFDSSQMYFIGFQTGDKIHIIRYT